MIDSQNLDAYNERVLSIVCPICHAAVGGKCLVRKKDGYDYKSTPHEERIQLTKVSEGE